MSKLVNEGEELDLSEFRITASDTKGHSARQWFRCIPQMARQVEQIIQSKTFPYRTKGDMFRHALHRHTQWLSRQAAVPSISGQVDAILEIMRDEEMNSDFVLVFNKLNDRIKSYLGDGSDKEAARLVVIIQSHIRDMPDGFWKSKYQKEIEDKYGKLLGGVGKLNLGEMGEE